HRRAAIVRVSQSLLLRMVAACIEAGEGAEATALVENYLARNPNDRVAARMLAAKAAEGGDWRRARLLLDHLRRNGASSDGERLAHLSPVDLRGGDGRNAEAMGRRA